MTTIAQLQTLDIQWRAMLEGKGYQSIHIEYEIEPIGDRFYLRMWWSNSEYSSTHLSDLEDIDARCSLDNIDEFLETIHTMVTGLPLEHEAREQALLKDYAKIKERISASNLSDLVKAEAESLMKMMTTNILPSP